MRASSSRVLGLSFLLALSPLTALAAPAPGGSNAGEAHQDAAKKKATVASVTARRDALVKTRDGLRALAARPAPKDLTPAEKKSFDALIARVTEVADGCDAAAKKLTDGLKAEKQDLDSMSEMGEMESLRLQMAMDRQAKMMSTLSNILKKISDTASTITQNLK